jgi:hypothetical protein
MDTVTPYDERDENSGQFTAEFQDRDFLRALENNGGGTTSEVADAVGCEYRTAYARLQDLDDEGRVSSREIGNSLLWEAVETVGDTTDERDDHGRAEPDDTDAGDTNGALTAAVEKVADGWDVTSKKLANRKAAARAVLEYARENGSVSKQEAQDEFLPEHSISGQDARTWYRQTVKPALREVAEYDNSERAYVLELEDNE